MVFSEIPEEELYATLISVKYKEGIIVINFEPIQKEILQYRIYRSQNPILNKADLANSTILADISRIDIPYLDTPEQDGKYYYAVTIIKDRREHINLVPFQNTILRAVDYSPLPETVEKIEIKPQKDRTLDLYFNPVKAEYSYKLYISSEKVIEIQDQKPAFTIKDMEDHFSVQIKENTPYYFIITSVNRLEVENKKILIGRNTNSEAFIIKVEKPKKVVTVSELIENNLKYNFYRGNYKKALKEFQTILRMKNLTPPDSGTVHFYIGQCYFYSGEYRKAVKYFIISKETKKYIHKAEVWIDRCLEQIE